VKWIERFDLFLLDCDGLLVDTERLHYKAYQTVCARYSCDLPWDFKEYLGYAHQSSEGIRKAVYSCFPDLAQLQWDELYREKKKIYLEILMLEPPSLMPGVETFLNELALGRKKRCVVTHSPKEQIESIKHALPILKTVPVWITREDYEAPKPAPDGYFKAIEILADPGDQIIGFEDSFKGLSALQKTQALPVLVCDPDHPQLKGQDLSSARHFTSFSKIPPNFKPVP